jgi:hypothetical protein
MKQILIIHGADTFKTYEEYLAFLKGFQIDFEKFRRGDWKSGLRGKLGEDFEVILPIMPNKFNARYEEWKIWLEKLVPFLEPEIVLVGHSMGGAFLAKYLSQNTFPKKVLATFMIGAPYSDKYMEGTGETIGDFAPQENLDKFSEQGGKIYIYHSKDDPIAPFLNAEGYKKRLEDAEIIAFSDKGHFQDEEFPELVEKIKAQFKN